MTVLSPEFSIFVSDDDDTLSVGRCAGTGRSSNESYCNASESLVIFGAGSGKVYYTGSPAKVSNRTIGVKAISIDSAGEEQ